MKMKFKNIGGCFLLDAEGAFLNGAGLGQGEDKNKVIPKTFKEKIDGRFEKVPYVSAQAWRRWLRNTVNEENGWPASELHAIQQSEKGSTSKIATQLNPIDYPEDDIFGYMRSGKGSEESIQRTTAFKTSILRAIRGKRAVTTDDAFVHLKDGSPLPYSTEFYSSHLEGFFNLEYYRLGVYDNLGSRKELSENFVKEYKEQLEENELDKKYIRYTLKDAENIRKERAAGLLKGLAYLSGGAKQAAFATSTAPKALILAGMDCANPVFNKLFKGEADKPMLDIEALQEITRDYKRKMRTPVYIGIRSGYLQNEEEVKALHDEKHFIVTSPVEAAFMFNTNELGVREEVEA